VCASHCRCHTLKRLCFFFYFFGTWFFKEPVLYEVIELHDLHIPIMYFVLYYVLVVGINKFSFKSKKNRGVSMLFFFYFCMCFVLTNTNVNSEVTLLLFNYMFSKLSVLQL
jgi:hypothetical protein